MENPVIVEWLASAVGLSVAFLLGMLFERRRHLKRNRL